MKLLFDTSCLAGDKLTGIGHYSKQLFIALKKQNQLIIPVVKSSRWHKAQKVKDKIGENPWPWFSRFLHNGTVYLGPDYKLQKGFKKRKIVVVHDMLFFEKEFLEESFAEWGRKLLKQAISMDNHTHVICDTDFTSNRFKYFLPDFPGQRVHTVLAGCDHINHQKTQEISFPYILYTGTLEYRKNVIMVIKAFEKIAPNFPELKLVLIGGNGYRAEEIHKAVDRSSVKSRILRKGYVSSEELSNFYVQAKVFFYPSLYEGFGLPILEAMRCGVPVITSNIGAMAEVAGDKAVLIDPCNPDQAAEAITRVLNNDSLAASLVKLGKKHASNFSWEKTAQQVYKIACL